MLEEIIKSELFEDISTKLSSDNIDMYFDTESSNEF